MSHKSRTDVDDNLSNMFKRSQAILDNYSKP